MCFSASASFIASGSLAIIGALCIKTNHTKKMFLLDCIPLLFSLQQASEGLLWLSINHQWPYVQQLMPYIFLFFASLVWPILIPSAIMIIEPSYLRRHCLMLFVMLGVILALCLYSFILLHGVQAEALNCHIYYQVTVPNGISAIASVAYVLATIVPFFVSSLPAMWLFGVALVASYAASYIWYMQHFVSVWCFFAALLSCLIYAIIKQLSIKNPQAQA